MVGGSGNKVVATLRADGSVRPTEGFMGKLATLMNYKIRTEAEVGAKTLNTVGGPTTVVDLGKQLLQYARDSDVKGVKNMMSRGAPFTSDWLGMSALHFAAMNNQFEICEALLKGGINKDSKTKVDRTPLHLACYYGNERIVELLLSKNCCVNPRDMLCMTPLHWSVEKRHKSIVRMLLEHGADVTLTSKFGRTPVALAVLTEQADLLEELEAAKQLQASRKINDEQERETSDAVNSIIGLKGDIAAETEMARSKSEVHSEDELTNASDYADAKMADFENINETGILDKNAINLLKSHGITMMQDDEDTSKDLLTTALQNGRQLVLTEGGKLLLHEANKRTQNNGINNNNNNTSSSNKNNNNTIVPVRLKSGDLITPTPQINKIRSNVIAKAKDNPSLGRNKNIRIISLNDFKRLYGNTHLKAIQKLPSSLSTSRLVRQLTEEDAVASRKVFVNAPESSMPSSQCKVSLSESTQELPNSLIEKDESDPMDIIEIEPTDSEAEAAEIEQPIRTATIAAPTPSLRVLPATRQRVEPVRVQPATVKQQLPISVGKSHTAAATNTSATGDVKQSSTVIPLLTTPEICRQLFELRKQNEELRRKFDLAQKEKEEMRQRLERLEELYLVEKTDDDYAEL